MSLLIARKECREGNVWLLVLIIWKGVEEWYSTEGIRLALGVLSIPRTLGGKGVS